MVGCPGGGDTAEMVLISGAVDYCIDSTEVTNAQYATWLAKKPSTDNQPSECTGNAFIPMNGEPPMDNKPVVWVDWCDAYGYCKDNGKRLCGKIGGNSLDWADFDEVGLSQWYKACTMGGARSFPYGTTYDGMVCNVGDLGSGGIWDVGSGAMCEGGYPGIFDMSGNVWEWEDACDTMTTKCRRRGGSYTSDSNNVTCIIGGTFERLMAANNGGFRCCADLP